jgi:hypothetical protein
MGPWDSKRSSEVAQESHKNPTSKCMSRRGQHGVPQQVKIVQHVQNTQMVGEHAADRPGNWAGRGLMARIPPCQVARLAAVWFHHSGFMQAS